MVPLASYKIRNEEKMLCLIKVNYTSFSLFFLFVLKLVLTTIYYKRNYIFMVFYYWSKRYKRLKFYPTIMSSTKIVLKDIQSFDYKNIKIAFFFGVFFYYFTFTFYNFLFFFFLFFYFIIITMQVVIYYFKINFNINFLYF